jgi:Kef-type K+ transport system membrane component KefB
MAAILLGFMVVKLLVIYFLAGAMKLPFQDRPVFTLLLAQGGEFAFVVFQAAAGARVFSPEVASLLIGAVALSMLLSPLLLLAVDPPVAASVRELQRAGAGRNLGAAGRAHHHRWLRPLRPDRRPHAVGAGHPVHGAGP